MTDVEAARDDALERVAAAATIEDVTTLQVELLGKRSRLAAIKQGLGSLAPAERKAAGQALNDALATVNGALEERRHELTAHVREARVEQERLDLTETLDAYR